MAAIFGGINTPFINEATLKKSNVECSKIKYLSRYFNKTRRGGNGKVFK